MSATSTTPSKPGDPLRKLAAELRRRAAPAQEQTKTASSDKSAEAAQVLVATTAMVQLNNQIYG